MCGIIGTVDWSGNHPPDVGQLRQMLGLIKHRGPDEFGLYVDHRAGIGCARLSIVDLVSGQQPIANEDESLWIVFNGEIYNYPELRAELVKRGHRFSTQSDTEVILHLYEEMGPACLKKLNGQFAIAIWDNRRTELFLARDRFGIRPLFYTRFPQGLAFGSEIKALLLDPRVEAAIDPHGLAQAFTFWAPLAPRTAFEGVRELPPGHWAKARDGGLSVSAYWSLEYPPAGEEPPLTLESAAEHLRALLADATRLRLRADVEVGSYLSGGIDSTFISALVRHRSPENLRTFSVSFAEPAFDERSYQEIATAFLQTDHRRVECQNVHIGEVFPEVVWHTEAPLLRTSPAPMYLLSRLVHENDIKVVLTGEGADEFLGGYNIYKEDKIRRFWARQPASTVRPMLLQKLYPYIADLPRGGAYLEAFFRQGLTDVDQAGYSHQIRWRNGSRWRRIFSPHLREGLKGYQPAAEFLTALDGHLSNWSDLAQAQYLEITTFMSPYLLSSQGDRMMAANSVEGRFPFLDHRVVEFCNQLPPRLKLRALREKHILKKSAEQRLPAHILRRQKRPYRAPIHSALLTLPEETLDALVSREAIRKAGLFDPDAATRLVQKCRTVERVNEGDDMALVGVLSTQLLHHCFIETFARRRIPEIEPLSLNRGGKEP